MSNPADYERRFKARIIERLSGEGSTWTAAEMKAAADSEWDAFEEDGSEATPEDAADECLSYWDDDGDSE